MTTRSVSTPIGVLGLAAAAGLAIWSTASGRSDTFANLPSQVTLSGTVRDVKSASEAGGVADFQRQPSAGFAHYMGQVQDNLGADGLPVFASAGYKVTSQWRDALGRNIIRPKSYLNARPGDIAGATSSSLGGSLTNATNFNKWYRDIPGTNVSAVVPITLVRQPNSNRYVFDDTLDPTYQSRHGFFPIDGALYGNYASSGHNFHFTYQIETQFTYEQGAGHIFTFRGDDDVWVYVDGKLVIDLGGVHAAVSQTVELDRLNWLVNGQVYSLRFFFAERHTTQSNFRIETTLLFRQVQPPAVAALCD